MRINVKTNKNKQPRVRVGSWWVNVSIFGQVGLAQTLLYHIPPGRVGEVKGES